MDPSEAIAPAAVKALGARLARAIGREIPTPEGPGVLQAVEGGSALVLMEHRYTVAFAVNDLIVLEDERCALCGAPAEEWCAACGQPVCQAHQGHGARPAEPTAFMLAKVVARLRRSGSVTLPEPELAYAVVAFARAQHLGGVEVEAPSGGRRGLRLVLHPA